MRLRVLACLVLSCLCASESSAQQQVVESPLPPQSVRIGRGDANPQGHAATHLCVDWSQQAWLLVYAVLPQDLHRSCAKADMERVPRARADALEAKLHCWIVHESQPAAKVAQRVVALALQQPGMPVGLTWDGGMAVTANDYAHAERRLQAYRDDPQGYAMKYWNGQF